MTRTATLLAATDFSDPARHALERAAQLASTHNGALLTLTHAISSSMLERLLGLMQGETLTVKDRLLHETQAALTTQATHAEIVLLHAFGVEMESTLRFASVAEEQIHAYRVRARESALASMERFASALAIPTSRLTRLVVHGAATLQILEHEQSLDIDLIAMGKHGQSALEELLLGSVTKHVLAYSSGDVLVAGHPD